MKEQKLTNSEIAKVFAMYYYAECIALDGEKGTVNVIGGIPTNADYYKLLLTSLSKITDEHAELLYHLYCGEISKYDYTQDFGGIRKAVRHWLKNGGLEEINKYSCLTDLARQMGYATKIYFPTNHWANGKTAIELGIAIETPTP